MVPVSRLQLGKFRATEKLGSIIKTIYHLGHRAAAAEAGAGVSSRADVKAGERFHFAFTKEEEEKEEERGC